MADRSDQQIQVVDVVEPAERPPETAGRMVVRRFDDGAVTSAVAIVDARGEDDWGVQ